MNKILVIGAGGYIGTRLVSKLVGVGHRVTCMVREPSRIATRLWSHSVEVMQGDALRAEDLAPAVAGVDAVYYLVHSMASSRGDFEELDRQAAVNLGTAARNAGVKRIIYLGGLGRRRNRQSRHLRSRHEVGDLLRESGVPVTEFRAAVVVGAGSLSFEMIHHLANRLPVMICPRWVVTRTQPVAIDDVLAYLVASLECRGSIGKTVDIGGPDVMTYREMMLRVARILGLRRCLIQVPVLTPRLSSYWVGLVTPVPVGPARALIEGLRHETICENDDARRLFDIAPIGFDEAAERALSAVMPAEKSADPHRHESVIARIEPSHLLTDRRQVAVNAPVGVLFGVISSIGGDNGWYAADVLWRLRGLIDEALGGVGLRRGRRDPESLAVGEALDFWRVEELEADRRVLLRAEMKLPGKAWLEFQVDQRDHRTSLLTQTARFYPRGLPGIVYWYGIYPMHALVFRRLVKAIGARAEKKAGSNAAAGR